VTTEYFQHEDLIKNSNLDSIEETLIENLKAVKDFTLTRISQRKMRGTDIIEYQGKGNKFFTTSILVPLNKKRITVTYLGQDSTNRRFEKIVQSINIKHSR